MPRTFQRSRRATNWQIGPSTTELSFAATSSALWDTGRSGASAGNTIVRIRGMISYYLTAGAAAGDGFVVASGIYMMDRDSFAAGVGSALDPLSDADSDQWMWHSFGDVRQITATIADGVNAGGNVFHQVIDSKAMRKDFDEARVLAGVTQVIEQGTSGLEVFAQTRILVKT